MVNCPRLPPGAGVWSLPTLGQPGRGGQELCAPFMDIARLKNRELQFKNNGRQWLPEGAPIEVSVHDFPDKKLGKAVPYGILDIASNRGYVNVGINHDTGEFAVASIKRWWKRLANKTRPHGKRLLVPADSGGSNGYRLRLWKKELQRF